MYEMTSEQRHDGSEAATMVVFRGRVFLTAGTAGAHDGDMSGLFEKQQRAAEWQPTPVLLPGKSQGQRSLVGHSP